jgi:hypothetical protein
MLTASAVEESFGTGRHCSHAFPPERVIIEVTLVQLSFDLGPGRRTPENLLGDLVSDSDQLDEQLRNNASGLSATHRSNRKRPDRRDSLSRTCDAFFRNCSSFLRNLTLPLPPIARLPHFNSRELLSRRGN